MANDLCLGESSSALLKRHTLEHGYAYRGASASNCKLSTWDFITSTPIGKDLHISPKKSLFFMSYNMLHLAMDATTSEDGWLVLEFGVQVHSHTHALTHTHTHSLTLTHTHSLTHSLTHSPALSIWHDVFSPPNLSPFSQILL